MTFLPNTILSTVNQVNNTEMDIQKEWTPNNYNEMRDRFLSQNMNISRNISMSLTISAEPYHKRMA